jgi:hypothetical protein
MVLFEMDSKKCYMILRRLFQTIIIGFFILSFFPACLKADNLDPEEEQQQDTPQEVVKKLNKNVVGLKGLAEACIRADSIAVFDIDYLTDGSVLYWLSLEKGGDIELYSEIVSSEMSVPELSMSKIGDEFFWIINGAYLTDSDGTKVSVAGMAKPVFSMDEESIYCKINNSIVGHFPTTRADYLARDVFFDYDIDNSAFNLRLSSGYRTTLPTISVFHLLEEKVINQSYYKDVFLDAGIGMTSRKSLAAADYLGLSLEGMSFPYSNASSSDKEMQIAIIAGDSNDSNGRLLYPDGQPRYKLLFVNGGNSTTHGRSLSTKGLVNMISFVENGGCYVGTCAGAFLASNGYDGMSDYPSYLWIWPGMMRHSGLRNVHTGMFIEKNSPLLDYYDFGGDNYVANIRHNLGGYPESFPLRTEILARFDYPKNSNVHRKPSIWAYKNSQYTGRIVMEASHPEEVPDGERRDLTAAMMQYAMDGRGVVSLKGFLKNGVERLMDKTTEEKNPAFTRIGDLQTHHFAAYIPPDAKNIKVEVSSSSDCDLALMMNQKTFAFSGASEYQTSVPGHHQQLAFPFIREGIWYISVQCLTTVTVTETDYGQAYSGKTEVLNGVPYKIMISWE